MFRVVSDQLKISDGWVRCGHCSDVFDATLYLDTWVAPDAVSAPAPGPQPGASADDATALNPSTLLEDAPSSREVADAPLMAVDSSPPGAQDLPAFGGGAELTLAPEAQDAEEDDDGTWLSAPVPLEDPEGAVTAAVETPHDALEETPTHESLHADALEDALLSPAPALAAAETSRDSRETSPPEEDDFHAELARFAAAHDASGVTAPMPLVAPEAAEPAAADEPVAAPEPVPLAATAAAAATAGTDASPVPEALPEPGFVRQARRRAFWRTPAVRAVLASLALLLVLLLAGQWALHERHQLAARHPELRPWLVQLCEPLGCRVEPARRIDAIVIDSTALVRRLGNFYSFDLVLKNTAPMDLAMPALELSLTDTRDAVIARRVFLPDELPGAPALLPAQDSVALSLRLSLAVGDALPMAGYRALVFYP